MTNKTKLIIANILIIFGLLCLASSFVVAFIAKNMLVIIVSLSSLGLVFIIVGGLFWKKSDHPIVEQQVKEKPKKPKVKKNKKPFLSDKEWQEEEDEDDEMMFIEEEVEND